tara:strand:- start:62 stop:559 length:498 start_codon:yes stop_codon:yes gene_type:complete
VSENNHVGILVRIRVTIAILIAMVMVTGIVVHRLEEQIIIIIVSHAPRSARGLFSVAIFATKLLVTLVPHVLPVLNSALFTVNIASVTYFVRHHATHVICLVVVGKVASICLHLVKIDAECPVLVFLVKSSATGNLSVVMSVPLSAVRSVRTTRRRVLNVLQRGN